MVLNVNGVGYEVIPSVELSSLASEIGQKLDVFIHTHVREDQLTLFGFASEKEKDVFRLLLKVSGVGPKTALAVLSAGGSDKVKDAISAADVGWFSGISGVGKKTAQRIIVDLKGKIGGAEIDLTRDEMAAKKDLIRALKSMRFDAREAMEAAKNIDVNLRLEDQLKQALKKL